MDPFYRWGSTASRLQPLRGVSLLFTIQFPEIQTELTLEPPIGFEQGPLDWESSAYANISTDITKIKQNC